MYSKTLKSLKRTCIKQIVKHVSSSGMDIKYLVEVNNEWF